jgi:hypothetical protein
LTDEPRGDKAGNIQSESTHVTLDDSTHTWK